jgi:hypothetical protein
MEVVASSGREASCHGPRSVQRCAEQRGGAGRATGSDATSASGQGATLLRVRGAAGSCKEGRRARLMSEAPAFAHGLVHAVIVCCEPATAAGLCYCAISTVFLLAEHRT